MPCYRLSRVAQYCDVIEDGPDDESRYRMLVHDLPRQFRQLGPAARVAALEEAPRLTGTRWDALLAAMAEHVAEAHGLEKPAWVDEPGRFLDPPWAVLAAPQGEEEDRRGLPGCFRRHGALPDAADLDRWDSAGRRWPDG